MKIILGSVTEDFIELEVDQKIIENSSILIYKNVYYTYHKMEGIYYRLKFVAVNNPVVIG